MSAPAAIVVDDLRMNFVDLGQIRIIVNEQFHFAGNPWGHRFASSFHKITWEGDVINAESVWQNGCYRGGGDNLSEANIRALFLTDDNAQLYMDYTARFGREDGEPTGRFAFAGTLEAPEASKYNWLNLAMIVGQGAINLETMIVTYNVSAVRA